MKPLGTQIVAEFIYCSKNILNDRKALEQVLKLGIKESGLTLVSMTGKQFHPVGVTVIAVISESHIGIHTYPEARHASIDIFTCAAGSKSVSKLLRFLKSKMNPKTVRVIELARGNPLEIRQKKWITTFSGSGFEIKYHIKKNLLSRRSAYQQIDIIENDSFGKMLFLDKDLQISEKDAHAYNTSMVSPLVEAKNRMSKVAVLGGGDGGILHEVLKYRPASAYLIEIDEAVINASKKHLKSICKNAFSNSKAKIIIEDANKFLEQKHGFDAVIYDLTMHPESITRMERARFLNELFLKVKNNLNKKGMISLQCCSEYDKETLKLLKRILPKYFRNINYQTSYIPSFCENWIFASAEVK
ncbi:MAG: adenosylmethionine decarboxylase [Candidatus Heimdallarchaeota archaeon]|nr:adenosylmethionine decarboxylase [Candidatus Heimdallarchaeota archaeon]